MKPPHVMLAMVALAGGATVASPQTPPLFAPPGMVTNDNWFVRDGGTYHAFYLQAPACLTDWPSRAAWRHVGHATSDDLVHWTDHGPCLVAIPGTWNDRCIATGSIARHAGRWWMAFTAVGRSSGMGLAVSDDLYHWEKVGEGPVVPFDKPFGAVVDGQPVQWQGLADPYLYPGPIAGWYYAIINAQIVGAPLNTSGCLATMRSRDLISWEPSGVLAYPRWFERLETPQVWEHDGRWYLYFGAAHDHELPEGVPAEFVSGRRLNCLFIADAFEGPYRPAPRWRLDLPDGRGSYIHKVLEGPDGTDVLLTTTDGRISRAYPVTYGADGSLTLGMPAVPAP